MDVCATQDMYSIPNVQRTDCHGIDNGIDGELVEMKFDVALIFTAVRSGAVRRPGHVSP